MNGIRTVKFGLMAALLLMAGQAFAQASRTWVSGVGDDANPCSRTAPCKTFAGAISKTAAGGEIDALDPAGYGALTITKSITIDGGGGQVASVLVAGTNGLVVAAGPSDVVRIRNVRINGISGSGNGGINGIRFISGGTLEIDHVAIFDFTNFGIDSELGGNGTLLISDTLIENAGAGGVFITNSVGTTFATLNRVTMIGGGKGLRVEDGTVAIVSNSTATSNTGNGFIANGNTRAVNLSLENSVAFNNGAGGVFSGSLATVHISRCNIAKNGTGLVVSGGTIVSGGNNVVHDNGTNGAPTSTPGQI